MKGKFPYRIPVCSVFAGDLGRARRRSWTSSLGCLASICSKAPRTKAPRTRKRRRHPLIITSCTIPGRPRAHIRMKVLLRHILETLLLGLVRIDPHLEKSLSLGKDMPTTHSSIHNILSVLYISTFRYFFCCSCFISAFQNIKRPKIFLLFIKR
jgi:hypothetical protein